MKTPIERTAPQKAVIGKRTRNPGYEPGNHWVDCDRCGATIRTKDAKLTWDNLVVCPNDWEPRHPQDFVKGREEDPSAKGLVRSEAEVSYVSITRLPQEHSTPAATNNNDL